MSETPPPADSKDGKSNDGKVDNKKYIAINNILSTARTSQTNLRGWSPTSGGSVETLKSGLDEIWDSPVAETLSAKITTAVDSVDSDSGVMATIISDLSSAASQQELHPGKKVDPNEHSTEANWKIF
ncbi:MULTISPECIES: hypothetical protein [Actinomyces]|uniref:hypothetical protein n=1 Tax=Actinomyces TaxID=1654 RepID=UPI000AA782A4|nr:MULTISPECIES: hypothetical protein [Actinomyces]